MTLFWTCWLLLVRLRMCVPCWKALPVLMEDRGELENNVSFLFSKVCLVMGLRR
jgi:hypothetical protein